MTTMTALTTIQHLRQLFAQFWIPESVVSDNGPQFSAAEFQDFCKGNGIRHIQVAPYHPSSNGLAERAVQVLKQGLKKHSWLTDRPCCVVTVQLQEHTTHHHWKDSCRTFVLLLGRKPRTRLDLLRPNVEQRVQGRQEHQQSDHDKRARQRLFSQGERVFVENHRGGGDKWLSGEIVEVTGPVSFRIWMADGAVIRAHHDHLRKRPEISEQQVEPPSENVGDEFPGRWVQRQLQ